MKINTRIIIGFTIILVLFAGTAIQIVVLLKRVSYDSIWNRHSYVVFNESSRLQNQLDNLQSNFKVYVANNDISFESRFNRLKNETYTSFDLLKLSVSDNPDQANLLTNIKAQYDKWAGDITEYHSWIKSKQYAAPDSTMRLQQQQGKVISGYDSIVSNFRNFSLNEDRLMDKRQKALDESIISTKAITITASLIALLIGIATALFTSSLIRRRILTLTNATHEITSGYLGKQIKDDSKDELSILVASINQMSETLNIGFTRLSQTNKELEQFAWITSHDLKEPLRMISLHTQVINEKFQERHDEEDKASMEFILSAVKRMYELINNLLEYSRIGRNEVQFQELAPANLLDEILTNIKLLVKEKNATITIKGLPDKIKANKTLLFVLFQNLIQNALKFHKENENPIIEIEGKMHHAKEWLFTIKDKGIGIDERYKDKIFDMFQRLNDRDKFEGTGIGLAICKKVVDIHGGKIWLQSQPDEGSTFFIALPVNPVPISREITNQGKELQA